MRNRIKACRPNKKSVYRASVYLLLLFFALAQYSLSVYANVGSADADVTAASTAMSTTYDNWKTLAQGETLNIYYWFSTPARTPAGRYLSTFTCRTQVETYQVNSKNHNKEVFM